MRAISLPIKRTFNWKVFLFGVALFVFAMVVTVPFVLEIMPISDGEDWFPQFLPEFMVTLLIGFLSLSVGLFLAGKIGFGLPFIESWAKREPIWIRLRGVVGLSILCGLGSIIFTLALGVIFMAVAMVMKIDITDAVAEIDQFDNPGVWKWFLISINAGISEEIIFRLGLMTLLSWLGGLVSRDAEGRPNPVVIWIANIIASIAFGVGHLFGGMPKPDSLVFLLRIVIQNTFLGALLGWLYWKFGLESAMLTHFFIDVGFYVVFMPVAQSNNLLLIFVTIVALVFVVRWAFRAVSDDKWNFNKSAGQEQLLTIGGAE